MPIAIDIDCLEKFDEVAREIILADLILGCVEFFHEVDESR